jgi:hypothetical protein
VLEGFEGARHTKADQVAADAFEGRDRGGVIALHLAAAIAARRWPTAA